MKFDWSLLLVVIVGLIAYKLMDKFLGIESMIEKIGQ
jgi:hypothetical protein